MKIVAKKRLGDLLVESRKIAPEQLKKVLMQQQGSGKRLGEILIEDGILSEEDILEVLEQQLCINRVYLDMEHIEQKVAQCVPESISKKYNLVAFGMEDNKLKIAMSDPLNIFAIDDVKISSGFDVKIYIASTKDIKNTIDIYYASQNAKKAAADLSKAQGTNEGKEENKAQLDDIKSAPAVRLVDSIISDAIKLKASDIHIEPFENNIKIRFRIDGTLKEISKYNKDIYNAFITRIKILAELNIAEKRIPQDGRILTVVDNKKVDLRVSTLPTINGEKIVIRVLDRGNFLVGKEKLGMNEDDLEKAERILKSPYGIILVTGPTGSGKSTTLYTLLSELNDNSKNIITVEDPVEYVVDGINQVNVNAKAGLTFASGLRSILRQDPDVVMIGEIRDNETAEIAVRAAITGHIVLSTIHTSDAPSAIVRLIDMDIQPYLVASAIAGIISQRLVKKICPMCSENFVATDFDKEVLGIHSAEELLLYKGKGCGHCNSSGYSGRIGVYEIMEVTRKHREYIMRNASIDEIKDISIENGMKTLKTSCIDLVLKGMTTIEELVKIAFLKE
ncbi:GspE/PulE family protein [Clostridium tagluense]|uniref:GspE/PulE family protein n=1 Tax=Clostridium tagluense TaxID=360422 RepID=UPI001CF15EC0|nr:GspE/PulE family protein [Clostridium tagluense]MCB2312650.1 GspE/PulE family protein [Clostridium tagluense]MCB2317416.1 GspE/PulE family protein [Clostridium tagluense]MCB2322235.1 GspE/PulE family protein [Clostridium tagluense]MCB2327241.1 GspE/PulE family protein [Clostridium tagluense]MCB2331917.1 GspE/PulE family protein [Clostridium tagluense]